MLDAESAMSELSDLLICPNCSRAYDEPKVLPCGQIVCTKCIAIILYRINKTCKEFKCLLCTDYHKLPMGAKMEFPTCEPLLKLIKKRSTTLTKDLKSNLEGLRDKMDQLKKDLYCGDDLIREYCESQRNSVHRECDILKADIDNLGKTLIDQIDDYETERLGIFNEKKNKFSLDLKEADCLYAKFYDQNNKTSDKILENLNSQIQALAVKLDGKQKLLLEFQLENERLLFKPAADSMIKKGVADLLGTIEFQRPKYVDELKDMKKMDLDSVLALYEKVDLVDFINESLLFVVGHLNGGHSKYCIIDINQKCDLYNTPFDSSIKVMNALFLQTKKDEYRIMMNYADQLGCNYLQLFDSTLTLLHQVKTFEYSLVGMEKPRLVDTQNSNVYCISRTSSSSHLRIYNWKLEYINAIGQSENSAKKYYFPSDTKHVIQIDRHYLVLNNQTLSTVDVETGNTLKSIYIQENYFMLSASLATILSIYEITVSMSLEEINFVQGQFKLTKDQIASVKCLYNGHKFFLFHFDPVLSQLFQFKLKA